jgi:hypothetical protein
MGQGLAKQQIKSKKKQPEGCFLSISVRLKRRV